MRATIPRAYNPVVNDEIQNRFDVGKKILAVVPGLESDKIVGQHRFDQLAMMGNAFDDGARRPRGVQEKPKRLGDAEITQFRAEREEMIILYPIGSVLLFEPKKRPGHNGVHFA